MDGSSSEFTLEWLVVYELRDWPPVELLPTLTSPPVRLGPYCVYWRQLQCLQKLRINDHGSLVLVTIEMLKALNIMSENQSLLVMPPWKNWSLITAITGSMMIHFVILYVPFMKPIFRVTLRNWTQ